MVHLQTMKLNCYNIVFETLAPADRQTDCLNDSNIPVRRRPRIPIPQKLKFNWFFFDLNWFLTQSFQTSYYLNILENIHLMDHKNKTGSQWKHQAKSQAQVR